MNYTFKHFEGQFSAQIKKQQQHQQHFVTGHFQTQNHKISSYTLIILLKTLPTYDLSCFNYILPLHVPPDSTTYTITLTKTPHLTSFHPFSSASNSLG